MDGVPFVTAGLNFIQPEHMGTPTPVKIRDARTSPTPFTLEANGFTLASQPTVLTREQFYEDALVKELYYPEVARGLEQLTGATKAFPILHRLRNGDQTFFFAGKRRGGGDGGGSSSSSSSSSAAGSGGATAALAQKCRCLAEFVPLVHCDNTVIQGKEMMQDFLRLNGAHEFLNGFDSRRYKIVNVWRNIRDEPITANNHPLCLLDSATLRQLGSRLMSSLVPSLPLLTWAPSRYGTSTRTSVAAASVASVTFTAVTSVAVTSPTTVA